MIWGRGRNSSIVQSSIFLSQGQETPCMQVSRFCFRFFKCFKWEQFQFKHFKILISILLKGPDFLNHKMFIRMKNMPFQVLRKSRGSWTEVKFLILFHCALTLRAVVVSPSRTCGMKKPLLAGYCALYQFSDLTWFSPDPQVAQTYYMNADVILACEQCCVTNGYLQSSGTPK